MAYVAGVAGFIVFLAATAWASERWGILRIIGGLVVACFVTTWLDL